VNTIAVRGFDFDGRRHHLVRTIDCGPQGPVFEDRQMPRDKTDQPQRTDKVVKTDIEWRRELTPESYHVTREHGTERAFTSPLNKEKRAGVFECVCCGEPLFKSEDKFDSGTGWPSYTRAANPNAVAEHDDWSFFMRRTEVKCARCDAHLGHVFPDGPRPTGMRYCINGVALKFDAKPDEAKK
jgi:peptide-methionine (R)-S-oxide reductase